MKELFRDAFNYARNNIMDSIICIIIMFSIILSFTALFHIKEIVELIILLNTKFQFYN